VCAERRFLLVGVNDDFHVMQHALWFDLAGCVGFVLNVLSD
jgi:hypothetical protein